MSLVSATGAPSGGAAAPSSAGVRGRLFARRVRDTGRTVRGHAIRLALLASVAGFGYAAWLYADALRQNRLIGALNAGRDIEVDPASEADELVRARANYLLVRDRLGEAQAIADVSVSRMAPASRRALLYNLANARVRAAIADIEKGALDTAISHVNLAKAAYRDVLRLHPADWDAKYNLDVAMRLVRDLPQAGEAEDETAEETPSQLWTDLPGIPKGLP